MHTSTHLDRAGPSPRFAPLCRHGRRIFSSPAQASSVCDTHQNRDHGHHFGQNLPIMSEDQALSSTEVVQRQVRVQLTSEQEDIALPESTGPILVPTGLNSQFLAMISIDHGIYLQS